jgi:hypothetical protein
MNSHAEIELSESDIEAVRTSQFLKVPTKTGIFRGACFSMRAKIGGRMQLVMVRCKGGPYEREIKGGKTALYVDVFGYGVDKAVNITRLREQVKEDARDG